MTCTIPLTQGYVAIVDPDDYEWLSQWTWCVALRGRSTYALTRTFDRGPSRTIYMHRLLTNADSGEQVDHINHDGLDNRRSNLRVCTTGQNRANQRKTRGTSQYKGVSWFKRDGKWRATIKHNSRQRNLGYYENEEDAARAYDRAALQLFGDFAALNFP